ncbi:hypothetical protein Ancab_011779 [Ancistrocladus abbreviatus]
MRRSSSSISLVYRSLSHPRDSGTCDYLATSTLVTLLPLAQSSPLQFLALTDAGSVRFSPNSLLPLWLLCSSLTVLGKVAALMSGTTLNLELEGVLCISKFALRVKPEVKAEVRNIERSVLVSFKPDERDFVDVVDVQNYICQMNNEDPYQYLHGAFFS